MSTASSTMDVMVMAEEKMQSLNIKPYAIFFPWTTRKTTYQITNSNTSGVTVTKKAECIQTTCVDTLTICCRGVYYSKRIGRGHSN